LGITSVEQVAALTAQDIERIAPLIKARLDRICATIGSGKPGTDPRITTVISLGIAVFSAASAGSRALPNLKCRDFWPSDERVREETRSQRAGQRRVADVLGSSTRPRRCCPASGSRSRSWSFVSALLVGLCGMIFALVSHIFGALTPAIRAEPRVESATRRSRARARGRYGLVLADQKELRHAFYGYDNDPDILAIVATTRPGRSWQRARVPGDLNRTFEHPAGVVDEQAKYFASWTDSVIEAARSAPHHVFVSTARISPVRGSSGRSCGRRASAAAWPAGERAVRRLYVGADPFTRPRSSGLEKHPARSKRCA